MKRILACLAGSAMLLAGSSLGGCGTDRASDPRIPPSPHPGVDADRQTTAACGTADVLASFELDVGRVDILDVGIDSRRPGLVVSTRWTRENVCRRVSLRPILYQAGWRGFQARSDAERESLRFAVALQWSTEEVGRLRIVEWNREDRLALEIVPQGSGQVLERYTWNGRTGEFDRPVEAGAPSGLEKRSAWSAFYPGSSLENDLEGERLVQLLLEEAFVRWLDVRLGGTGDVFERGDGIGDWLTVCAAFKCALGGIANPVCHACFGGSIAIAIGNLLCETVADCR